MDNTRTSITIIRWTARALGLALAGLHGAFFFGHLGEFLDMHSPPPFAAWTSMLLLLIIMTGYLIAWRFEATGSVMVIGGALMLFPRTGVMFPVYAGIVSIPAFMHLWCRFTPHSAGGRPNRSPRHTRITMTAAVAIPLTFAGLFVLEIFTHHGTPYTGQTLPGELVGTWSGTGVVRVDPETGGQTTAPILITVHPGGAITGTVGSTPVTNAVIQKNRNWFYRKINFYTDHIIEGTLGGEIEPGDGLTGAFLRFPCNIRDGALKGTIFRITRWSYTPIVNRVTLTRDGPSGGGEDE